MDKPCYWDTKHIRECKSDNKLDCFLSEKLFWENCLWGKLSQQFKNTQLLHRKAKLIRAAILNEICETFDYNPDIMKKIEALNLEETIERLL